MTDTPKFPRTWDEQKQYEHNVRKRWLEQIAAMGGTQSDAARYAGLERAFLMRMARKFGVEFPTVQKTAQLRRQEKRERDERERQRSLEHQAAALRKRKAEMAPMAEIKRRKAALMAEGFTEQQALRALAHQLGVTQEAAQ